MKIVIVLDETLAAGVMANTAAALAMSCSTKIPGLIGRDVRDADMNTHPGLLTRPVTVLSAEGKKLQQIKESAVQADLEVIGFTDVARRSKSYDAYIESMSTTGSDELEYLGLCVFGDRKKVTGITGALPLVK
ncbi:MAG TPA: DUF2000 domain-containing protein [Spirochaetota bacterium]|nr:DUF2000 domain-containing protein [Spirochaetota bacterium]HPJ35974.1 DUF2000 domain-containing protein [Spirochaetota bacterium]